MPDPRHRRHAPLPRGEIPNPINPPEGCRFHPRCPLAVPGLCDTEQPTLRVVAEQGEHLAACHLRTGDHQHLAAEAAAN